MGMQEVRTSGRMNTTDCSPFESSSSFTERPSSGPISSTHSCSMWTSDVCRSKVVAGDGMHIQMLSLWKVCTCNRRSQQRSVVVTCLL